MDKQHTRNSVLDPHLSEVEHDEFAAGFHLKHSSASYDSEETALSFALRELPPALRRAARGRGVVNENDELRVLVASDALSLLKEMKLGDKFFTEAVIRAREDHGVIFSFIYVPSHVGVFGNEIADFLAGTARCAPHASPNVKENGRNSLRRMINITKKAESASYAARMFNTKNSDTMSHYRSCWGDERNYSWTDMKQVWSDFERIGGTRLARVASQLRAGHCSRLRGFMFRPTKACQQCNVGAVETVTHYWDECPRWQDARRERGGGLETLTSAPAAAAAFIKATKLLERPTWDRRPNNKNNNIL